MKKLIFAFYFLCIPLSSFSNNNIFANKICVINGVKNVGSNGKYFEVDTTIITAKLNNQTCYYEDICKVGYVERINHLGYIDIRKHSYIPFDLFVYELSKVRWISEIEYCSWGYFQDEFICNDTYRNSQWNLDVINVDKIWSLSSGDPNIIVAIIDSGVEWTHTDLKQNIYHNRYEDSWLNQFDPQSGNKLDDDENGYIDDWLGWNFSTNSNNIGSIDNPHGTCVAGIIGAKINNHEGIAGIAGGQTNDGIRFVICNIGETYPNSSVLDDAIIYAVDAGAKVIQLSLECNSSNAIASALEYAYSKNVSIVCAAGNAASSSVAYPATDPHVISVGALTENMQRASFSNYGNELDVVAPGENIMTTSLDNNYASVSGTSYAAPHVSAIIALMYSIKPTLTSNEVERIICETANKSMNYAFNADLNKPYGLWNEEVGYGLVDAERAIKSLFSISGPSSVCREETYTIDGLPDGAEVQWIATVPRRLPHEDPIFAIPLLVKEGQGTSTVTFEQGHYNGSIIIGNTKPYVGEAVISAKITYGSASVTLTKDVYVQTTEHPEITLSLYPKPDIDVDSSFITHPGIGGGSIANPPLSNMASYEFSCANLEGHEDFQWTFVASNGTQVKDGRSVIVNHPAKGTLVVTLRHKDGCPDAAIATETYTVMGLRLLATNPASGSAEMQVVWDATPEGGTGAMSLSAVPTIPYEGEYEIELWDLLRGRLMVVEGEGGYTQFPLGGIPSGNYVLRLVIDGQQMDSLPLTVR